MIRKPRIGSIFFYVAHIDRTERFYKDVIGLDLTRNPDDGSGNPWLHAILPGNVDLLFFKGEPKPGNSPIPVFDLSDGGIDKTLSELIAGGASLVTPVSPAPGGWSCEFNDPDGYCFSLFQDEVHSR